MNTDTSINNLESNLSEANESSINDFDDNNDDDNSGNQQNLNNSESNLSCSTMKSESAVSESVVSEPSMSTLAAEFSIAPTETETETETEAEAEIIMPEKDVAAAAVVEEEEQEGTQANAVANTNTVTSLSSTTPVQSPTQSPTRDLSRTHTNSSEMSFNFDIDEHKLGSLHHHDGNILNEEELKSLAQSLAPRVTSLLDTNEKVLENLINEEYYYDDGIDDDSVRGRGGHKKDDGDEIKKRLHFDNDDDHDENYDDMEDEWNRLSNAEQMLRDELGMVSMGFNFVTKDDEEVNNDDNDEEDDDVGRQVDDDNDNIEQKNIDATTNNEKEGPIKQQQPTKNLLDEATNQESSLYQMNNSTPLASSANRQTYTLYDHAKYVDLQFSNVDLGYPTCPLLTKEDAEALLDVPSFRHEMLSMEKINDSGSDNELSDSQHTGGDLSGTGSGGGGNGNYDDITATNSCQNDDLQRPMSSQFKDTNSRNEAIREIMLCTREYIKPMTRAALSRIYEGLVDRVHRKKDLKRRQKANSSSKKGRSNSNHDDEDGEDRGITISSSLDEDHGKTSTTEILPVRTVAIQIRPDVLCGAVMDAVHTAIHSLRGEITRRQGNHLRALVPGCWVPETTYVTFRPHNEDDYDLSNPFSHMLTPAKSSDSIMNGMAYLPSFVVDVQLCARKRSRDGERILLFRFFRIEENQIVDASVVCPPSPPHANIDTFNADLIPDLKESNSLLRESSALFQRMRVVATTGGNIAFDMNTENDDVVNVSRRKSGFGGSTNNSSVLKQVLTSPLKLFSPNRDKRKKAQERKKRASKKSLSVRFQSNDSIIQGEKAAQEFASKRLLNSFEAAPSVVDEIDYPDMDPIPSLCAEDWPYVQSSWRYITLCLNELDNRDLNYSSLVSCPFGAFPALPTLDVQLCSQIKALCKDNMIKSLLKGAQDLEEFARESEYSCAKLIQLLQPTFLSYNLESPQQPEPISLASYPLEFEPPEVSCPPWGQKVVEALNLIAAKSPSADSCFLNDLEFNDTGVNNLPRNSDHSNSEVSSASTKTEFQKAREAAALVLAAFMKQEDEELGARLGRKNLQVMDRLAKMQAHKRDLIVTIRDSYGTNVLATKFAKRFHTYTEQILKSLELSSEDNAKDEGKEDNFYPASDQVPLITCRSISGKVPATCFVTCHQILLVTHPILGEAQVFLAKLSETLTEISTPKNKSMLNPISSTVTVLNKESKKELFSFRPLMGARPLKEFIDLLMDIAAESPEALQFSSRGGLLHMFEEKKSVQEAALGNER